MATKGMCGISELSGICDVTLYQDDTKGLLFPSICVNIVLFSTYKEVMTSNDVREECLECYMTSNDVREECYIIVMTGRCVNQPAETELIGCSENTFISNLKQLCK